MLKLAEQFQYDGFEFSMLRRVGLVALFSKRKKTHSRCSYEVVIIQQRPEHTFPNGKTVPAHEAMPGSEQWGLYGWTYIDANDAEARFKQLVKVQDSPNSLYTSKSSPLN